MHSIYNYSDKNYNFSITIKKFYNQLYPSFSELDQIHKLLESEDMTEYDKEYYKIPIQKFGLTDRNSIFIKNFHNFVDTDETFTNLYKKFIVDVIKPMCNLSSFDKIVYQKTPNIRFHLPNCSNIGYIVNDKNMYSDIIGVHNDNEFGHPKNEKNVIVPLTKMFGSNSLYYSSSPIDNLDVYGYNNLVMSLNNFYIGNLNECDHYNKINTTGVSRVSLDFRILLYSDYENYIKSCPITSSETFKNKFIVGVYYSIL